MDGRLTVQMIKDAVKNIKKPQEVQGVYIDINGVIYIDLKVWEEMCSG